MQIPTEVEAKISTMFKGLNLGLNKVEGETEKFKIKAYVVTSNHIRVDILQESSKEG